MINMRIKRNLKKLNCETNNTNYECNINKTFCESNCKVNETYPINILSKSEEPFFKIEILIHNTTSSGGDGVKVLLEEINFSDCFTLRCCCFNNYCCYCYIYSNQKKKKH